MLELKKGKWMKAQSVKYPATLWERIIHWFGFCEHCFICKTEGKKSKTYDGGLGDTSTQLAWMAYADANDIPHDHEDETVFKDGYHAGRENLESLEAQLAQAEDACYQMQTELSSQLVSTQKALKGLYNAVQRSRSVNDPLGKATAMEEAGRWF